MRFFKQCFGTSDGSRRVYKAEGQKKKKNKDKQGKINCSCAWYSVTCKQRIIRLRYIEKVPFVKIRGGDKPVVLRQRDRPSCLTLPHIVKEGFKTPSLILLVNLLKHDVSPQGSW